MSKKILIPTPLRPFVNQQEVVETQANNVNDALKDLVLNFPKLEQHLYDGNGNLRKFINIYVNDSDIRDKDGVNTNLTDSDEVSLVPAIAGGMPVVGHAADDAASSASRSAMARSSSGERLAHCSGGRGFDHSTASGAVRSGILASFRVSSTASQGIPKMVRPRKVIQAFANLPCRSSSTNCSTTPFHMPK